MIEHPGVGKEMNGYEAVRLWLRYMNHHDEAALITLLEYNKEVVVNLKTLKERPCKPEKDGMA